MEFLKMLVWPRGPMTTPESGKVYRYVLTGMLVSKNPIAEFEGKDQILLEGTTHSLGLLLECVKQKETDFRGTADKFLLTMQEQ
jgi:hypothetical protein